MRTANSHRQRQKRPHNAVSYLLTKLLMAMKLERPAAEVLSISSRHDMEMGCCCIGCHSVAFHRRVSSVEGVDEGALTRERFFSVASRQGTF